MPNKVKIEKDENCYKNGSNAHPFQFGITSEIDLLMQIVPTVKLYRPALGSLLLFREAFFRARSALIGKSRKLNLLLKFLVIHIINIIQFSVFMRIAIRAGGLKFNSWVGQIGHSIANDCYCCDVSSAVRAEMSPVTHYTLRRNYLSVMKI